MRKKNTFVLSPNYTEIINSKDEIIEWVERVDKAPIADKINLLRSTFYQHDYDRFWDIDPVSDTYISEINSMFKSLTGDSYTVDNEPVETNTRNIAVPYPFDSNNNKLISENLLGVSAIVGCLPVPPPAEILEMGCGWAHSGLTMGRAGYNVTCVDIDPSCAEIIDYWAPRFNAADRMKFITSDFKDVATNAASPEGYDVIVFFKSFHHCIDPVNLLKSCHSLLKPGGFLLLVAEPIHGNFYVPWGLRCDGTSIYAIIKHGWMELGFDTEFFDEMATSVGFKVEKRVRIPNSPTSNCDIYQKSNELH